ncbi:MAG: site-2 protease family protein [Spirochaetia bacterium]|nr:site-2 protease family protein [Spirochaetia bacterium]
MITTILAVAFLLGICIFVHELGHFLIGKTVGVQPRIFSIGYGRGIFFKKIGKTIYQITAIPLGGYVQFYGDDLTKKHAKIKKGDFFSVGPWRRMALAFGGPFFSLMFGFILIFILLLTGWRPATNKINIAESSQENPAYTAGLRNGDRVVEVNGVKTDYFEKINFHIALAAENKIRLKVERDGKFMDIDVNAVSFESGGPLHIGIQPLGEKYLVVKKGKQLEKTFLKEGDKILLVNGQKVEDIDVLRNILNKNTGGKVDIKLERGMDGLFNPNAKEKIQVSVPVQAYEYVKFSRVKDLQTEKFIPDIEIGSWDVSPMQNIFIGEKSYASWKDFTNAIRRESAGGKKTITFRIGAVRVQSNIELLTRGLMGISLDSGLDSVKMDSGNNLLSIAALTGDFAVVSTQSTLLGLYRIIEGKLSFRKSISGPVKIMKMTADSIKYGWDVYWMLFAQITIVLGIMNLMPFPVLDGGHIVMYFIEGVYKPLPVKVIAASMRVGVLILLTLGIYVIFLDIWDVFIARSF